MRKYNLKHNIHAHTYICLCFILFAPMHACAHVPLSEHAYTYDLSPRMCTRHRCSPMRLQPSHCVPTVCMSCHITVACVTSLLTAHCPLPDCHVACMLAITWHTFMPSLRIVKALLLLSSLLFSPFSSSSSFGEERVREKLEREN